MYIYIYITDQFSVHLKHCKSTIPQLKNMHLLYEVLPDLLSLTS